jgi:hypothetical protein
MNVIVKVMNGIINLMRPYMDTILWNYCIVVFVYPYNVCNCFNIPSAPILVVATNEGTSSYKTTIKKQMD